MGCQGCGDSEASRACGDGSQGWPGCAGVAGGCWVPAGDAGMTARGDSEASSAWGAGSQGWLGSASSLGAAGSSVRQAQGRLPADAGMTSGETRGRGRIGRVRDAHATQRSHDGPRGGRAVPALRVPPDDPRVLQHTRGVGAVGCRVPGGPLTEFGGYTESASPLGEGEERAAAVTLVAAVAAGLRGWRWRGRGRIGRVRNGRWTRTVRRSRGWGAGCGSSFGGG